MLSWDQRPRFPSLPGCGLGLPEEKSTRDLEGGSDAAARVLGGLVQGVEEGCLALF